jgi:archaellum component FlaC
MSAVKEAFLAQQSSMEIDELNCIIANLTEVLEECEQFIDGYVDVADGDYGIPEPNKAMKLMFDIKSALRGLR